MAMWRKQRDTTATDVSGGKLIIGWPGPEETTIRLARAGDQRPVDRFIRMAGVDEDRPAIAGIGDGSLADKLIAAADQGSSPLSDWIAAATRAADDPTGLWPAMTLVLVARDSSGSPIGALLAHPPMNIINIGINAGIPEGLMFATAGAMVRMRAVAVAPSWRGRGLGTALIRRCLDLYDHLGYLVVYGQIDISENLEDYYPRFGFDVLPELHGFSLSGLIGFPLNVAPGPGERLILRARSRLTVSKLPAAPGI